MKTYPMPVQFDGAKFAKRYGLNALRGDFWADATSIHVPDNLPDDPPIFEAPDAPAVVNANNAKAQIDTVEVLRAIVALILEQLNTLRAFHSLPALTMAQAVTAIKNKIDSGV